MSHWFGKQKSEGVGSCLNTARPRGPIPEFSSSKPALQIDFENGTAVT